MSNIENNTIKRLKKKETAFINSSSYRYIFACIVALLTSITAFSDETSQHDIHQADNKKTQISDISFDSNWKTLGLKKKSETVFIPINNRLRLESKQAVAFYYYHQNEVSQKPHSIPTSGYMLTDHRGLSPKWQQTFTNPYLLVRAYINIRRQESEIGDIWHKESTNLRQDIQRYVNSELTQKKRYLAVSAYTEDSMEHIIAEVKYFSLIASNCSHSSEHTT